MLERIRVLISEEISGELSISLKRGCSEDSLVYPEYMNIEGNGDPVMMYREEWRKQEEFADRALAGKYQPIIEGSNNSPAFDFRDTLVMRTWLAYAATIGDMSYMKITQSPVRQIPAPKRPVFRLDEGL